MIESAWRWEWLTWQKGNRKYNTEVFEDFSQDSPVLVSVATFPSSSSEWKISILLLPQLPIDGEVSCRLQVFLLQRVNQVCNSRTNRPQESQELPKFQLKDREWYILWGLSSGDSQVLWWSSSCMLFDCQQQIEACMQSRWDHVLRKLFFLLACQVVTL